MKTLFLFLALLFSSVTSFAQPEEQEPWDKNYVDTAILGAWKCEEAAMLKIMRTSRDYFLRQVIFFKDREKYEVERESHVWSWNFSQEKQEIEIADMEELLLQGYKIKQLDENFLILLMGKQEIIFKKVQ